MTEIATFLLASVPSYVTLSDVLAGVAFALLLLRW